MTAEDILSSSLINCNIIILANYFNRIFVSIFIHVFHSRLTPRILFKPVFLKLIRRILWIDLKWRFDIIFLFEKGFYTLCRIHIFKGYMSLGMSY